MPLSQTFRRVVGPLALAFAVVACTATGSTTSTTAPDGAGGTATTEPPASTTTVPEETTTTVPDLSGLDLPEAVIAQLEHLIVVTQEVRRLQFIETPVITVVDEAEFTRRVRDLVEEDLADLSADEALYKLLGLLPAEADLERMLTDLYEEQVAGYYDGRTREVVVPSRTDGLSLIQQGTMVHELVHALTDQHFGYGEQRLKMTDTDRWDEAAAYLALVEGDAMLAEVHWVLTLSQRDLGVFLAESLQLDTSILDTMPLFIQDSLLFPYDEGLVFVQTLHDRGGWSAVNEAYVEMPSLPGSTEQVLTPVDYTRDLPTQLQVTDVEVPGYELVLTSSWGELGLRLMFDQILGEERSLTAADGWGGDYYHQWFDGSNAAFVLVYVGDTEDDLDELRRALLDYQASAVADEAFVWVDEQGGYLHFVVADDPLVGELIKARYGLD